MFMFDLRPPEPIQMGCVGFAGGKYVKIVFLLRQMIYRFSSEVAFLIQCREASFFKLKARPTFLRFAILTTVDVCSFEDTGKHLTQGTVIATSQSQPLYARIRYWYRYSSSTESTARMFSDAEVQLVIRNVLPWNSHWRKEANSKGIRKWQFSDTSTFVIRCLPPRISHVLEGPTKRSVDSFFTQISLLISSELRY